ncbi:MAG: HD-GYP domain-containing protein [Candidatus Zixiibacteriota bacterium]|nr:MAG: HD-GYP domain-containing protein [candidate division Zixibacteria bacterium]
MLERTIERLQERIKDSHLKDVLAAELSQLLAQKPAGVRTDEYITAAAVIILKELKSRLIEESGEESPCRSEAVAPLGLDCETIINGLLIGMHHDLLESNLQMVKALGSAIAERDYGTSEHNFRVTIYAVRLGEKVNLEKQQLQALIKGSFLHDIGKIGIRDKTLLKPTGLTDREYQDVKRHVYLGRQIVQNVRWLEDAIEIIMHHHEKWDGTGYPEGLRGEDIPLIARIFSVADVFDALTSERPYKEAMPYDKAALTMRNEKGTRFDPDLLGPFLEISRDIYGEAVPQDIHSLEETVLTLINKHFQFSPTIDDLRDSFGSIARRGDDGRS